MRLIHYKTKPEASERNAELVSAVFAELKAAGPADVRYLTLRFDDDTFVHLVESTSSWRLKVLKPSVPRRTPDEDAR